MSYSEYNTLLGKIMEQDNNYYGNNQSLLRKLFDEYVGKKDYNSPMFHKQGRLTSLKVEGIDMGAIYSTDANGWWFIVGYSERWGLEAFYGKMDNDRPKNLNLSVKSNLQYKNSELTIRDLLRFFGVSYDGVVSMLYSPLKNTKSQTLNFSKGGFL